METWFESDCTLRKYYKKTKHTGLTYSVDIILSHKPSRMKNIAKKRSLSKY